MADALYIGSLVVENIKPRPKGEPSIELVISSARSGEITADAVDLDTSVQGEHQTLNVSLKSLEEDSLDAEIPDFELEQNEPPPTGLFEKASKVKREEKQAFPWLVVICVALILAAIGIAIWFFLLRDKSAPSAAQSRPAAQATQTPPPAPAPAAPAQQPSAAAQPSTAAQAPAQAAQPPAAAQTPPPVIHAPAPASQRTPASAPASRRRPAPPVASYNVPSVIPREGVVYRIRYGDTLWDIAEAFYRNPWLYPRIARFNNIRNPDLIISGTTIRVPPRN